MKNTSKLAVAALAGLVGAGFFGAIVANAGVGNSLDNGISMHKTGDGMKNSCKGSSSCTGKDGMIEKHACKGMNSCKGQGADGKNACKGQGSCRTDGK